MNGFRRFVWRNDCEARQKNPAPPPPITNPAILAPRSPPPHPPPLSAQGGNDTGLILGLVVGGIVLVSVVVLVLVLITAKKNGKPPYTRPGRDRATTNERRRLETPSGYAIRFNLVN